MNKAVSLGHHRSLIFYLATDDMQASSFKLKGQPLEFYRTLAGDSVLRVSVGIEDPDDLGADVEEALAEDQFTFE